VPANHLPDLGRRLDAAAPEWTGERVLGKAGRKFCSSKALQAIKARAG
jgi:hypothetical protein